MLVARAFQVGSFRCGSTIQRALCSAEQSQNWYLPSSMDSTHVLLILMSQGYAHNVEPRWKALDRRFCRAVVDPLRWIHATLLEGEDSCGCSASPLDKRELRQACVESRSSQPHFWVTAFLERYAIPQKMLLPSCLFCRTTCLADAQSRARAKATKARAGQSSLFPLRMVTGEVPCRETRPFLQLLKLLSTGWAVSGCYKETWCKNEMLYAHWQERDAWVRHT